MNSKPNADIRTAIKESSLCQYQVAEKIGVSEFSDYEASVESGRRGANNRWNREDG